MTSAELRDVMISNGLNVKKMAHLIHVSPRCIYHWLAGERKIPPLAWAPIRNIAKVSGCTL